MAIRATQSGDQRPRVGLAPVPDGTTSRRALEVVWGAWFVLMAGANLATPLYHVYAERFGFSTLVLTAIFTTYALVLVPAIVLFGRVSDRFGRRPVVLAGLAVASAGLLLFAFASGAAWLFAARALQGLAVGMISGAATAALVELDPDGDRRRAALLAGLAQAGGSAAGPLLAGALAEWAPWPLHTTFVIGVALTVAAALAVATVQDPAPAGHEPWRIQIPRVPPEVRHAFARVSLTAATAWATVALALSIMPSYASSLLGTRNLALLAAISALPLVASSVAQVAARRRRAPRGLGLELLACGLLLIVAATPASSLVLLVAGSIAAGVGHGLAFLDAQDELNELAPAEHRGEVTAAFIGCIYFLVACAVIGTGLLDVRLALTASVAVVSVGLGGCALAALAWQRRAFL